MKFIFENYSLKSRRILRVMATMMCILLFSVSLCACKDKNNEQQTASTQDESVDVLLITDFGTVNDGSFNQGAWEGIQKYGNEFGVKTAYYQPSDTSSQTYLDEIKRGIKNGAQLIICPGYLLEETVFTAQTKYPDTNFILLDGQPHNSDYSDVSIGDNVMSLLFAEEQAGFLAGYAAVRDGYTKLGYIGGIPEAPVIRFGYGFVQGIDYASIEMGVNVDVKYIYANTFYEDKRVEDLAAEWYQGGTEAIFACGGAMGRSVMRAAENNAGKVIGVDVDQSAESSTVITSAMKSLGNAVYMAIKDYYDGTFEGGKTTVVTAKENGVCLPLDHSRFNRFSSVEYNAVYSLLVDEVIVPYAETNIGTTGELTLINTNVNYFTPLIVEE